MNLVICKKGDSEITHFVKNAIKKGNDIFGDNISLCGVKPFHWDFHWTEDNAQPVLEINAETKEQEQTGWDKSLKDMAVSAKKKEVIKATKSDQDILINFINAGAKDSKELENIIKILARMVLFGNKS